MHQRFDESLEELRESHSPEAIRERLDEGPKHSNLGDFVLGAIDGAITTFAVVAGAVGALEAGEQALEATRAELAVRCQQAEELVEEQNSRLERVSGMDAAALRRLWPERRGSVAGSTAPTFLSARLAALPNQVARFSAEVLLIGSAMTSSLGAR